MATRTLKHPSIKHLFASTVGFTIGYFTSLMIEGTFGWHSYLAGAAGSIIGYTIVHYTIT